ncbi:Ig-like domain-containing protein, partial [Natronoflexus pectinivorans]
DFEAGEEYYVTIGSGAIVGFNGIDNSESNNWRFTTEKKKPGLVVENPLSPSNGATGVATDVALTVTFDQNIQFGSGAEVYIYEYLTDDLIETLTPVSGLSIVDTQLEITPSPSILQNGTQYYVTLSVGAIEATANDEPFVGLTDKSEWNFTTVYSTPVVDVYDPEEDSDDVPLDKVFSLTFSEDIKFNPSGSFNIDLRDEGGARHGRLSIENGSADTQVGQSLSISEKSLFMDFNSDLQYGVTYYITIPANAIQSLNNVNFGGITANEWQFTTKKQKPRLAEMNPLSPANGAVGVEVDTDLTVTFDINVRLGTGTITIAQYSDDLVLHTYDVSTSGGLLSVIENQLTISLPAETSFLNGTEYYVTFSSGAIESMEGAPFEGLSAKGDWSFTTVFLPPIVIEYIPEDDTQDVPVDQVFLLEFDQDIKFNELSVNVVSLYKEGEGSPIKTLAIVNGIPNDDGLSIIDDRILRIDFKLTLENDENYYITITPGAIVSVETDVAFGGIAAGDWSFKTVFPTPQVVSLSPVTTSTGIDTDTELTIEFDIPMEFGTGMISIFEYDGDVLFHEYDVTAPGVSLAFDVENKVLTITLPSNLEESTQYYVVIEDGALQSTDLMPFPGLGVVDKDDWEFTTRVMPPAVVSTDPEYEETEVTLNADLNVTFDRPVKFQPSTSTSYYISVMYNNGNGDILFREYVVRGTLSDPMLTWSNDNYTLNIQVDKTFEPAQEYYVVIGAGALWSVADDQPFEGIAPGEWTFTTLSDPDLPILVTENPYNPVPETEDFPVNGMMSLTFQQEIVFGPDASTQLYIRRVSDDFARRNFSKNSEEVSIIDNVLYIDLTTSPLFYGVEYYVEIEPGFISSAESGAEYSGFADTRWNFTTQTQPPAWSEDYPRTENQNQSGLNLKVQLDLAAGLTATTYYVITTNSTPPSAEQIIAGHNSSGISAIKSGSIVEMENGIEELRAIIFGTDIPSGQMYYIHLVAESNRGERSERRTLELDRRPPSLVPLASNPRNDFNAFDINSPITLVFNKPLYDLDDGELLPLTDISASEYISLELQGGGEVLFTFEISAERDTVIITPNFPLLENTAYVITINGLSDEFYNQITEPITRNFSTDILLEWSGAESSVFNNNGNWVGNYIPEKSVRIPSGLSNYPIISTNRKIHNLTIEAGASLEHTGGTLDVTGDFVLESSVNGNASYLQKGGALNVNPQRVRIEQIVTSDEYNYYTSPSVTGATKSTAGITGQAFYYNNSSNTYFELDEESTLESGRGLIFRSQPGTVAFTGVPFSGTLPIDMNRTQKGRGWHLLGNPYPAAINFTNLTRDNLDESFWIWLNDKGIYGVYNDAVGVGLGLDNLAANIIPSHHAFWVRIPIGEDQNVATGSGSLTFTPMAMVANSNSYLKSSSGPNYPLVKLQSSFNGYTDEAAVAIVPYASESPEDKYDSQKMLAGNENFCELFTLANGTRLAVNSLPKETSELVVPLGFSVKKAGSVTLSIKSSTLPYEFEVKLIDKQEGTVTNLLYDDYHFDVTSAKIDEARFELVLKSGITTGGIESKTCDIRENIIVYTFDSKIYAYISDLNRPYFYLYDVQGRLINSGRLNNHTNNEIPVENKGIFIFVIRSAEGKADYRLVF